MVTSQGVQTAAKATSIFLMVLGLHSHRGHQQLCLAPSQHLYQRTGSQKHVPVTQTGARWLGTSCITPGQCLHLPISGGSASKHSPLRRVAGVWMISDLETHSSVFPPVPSSFQLEAQVLLLVDPIYCWEEDVSLK